MMSFFDAQKARSGNSNEARQIRSAVKYINGKPRDLTGYH